MLKKGVPAEEEEDLMMFTATEQLGRPTTTTTRDEVLVALLHAPAEGLSVADLMASTNIARTTVQDVLATLQREQLVHVSGEEATRGRPRLRYALTDLGQEQFPTFSPVFAADFYHATEQLVGPAGMRILIDQMVESAVNDLPQGLPPAEVVTALNAYGYQAMLQGNDEIVIANCVFRSISKDTQSICRFDQKIVSHLSGGSAEQLSCMAAGDETCMFKVHLKSQVAQDLS